VAPRKASTVTWLDVTLGVTCLTVAGIGLALQITHVARPLGSFILFLGIAGNTFVTVRNASRVNREEAAQHARDRAAQ